MPKARLLFGLVMVATGCGPALSPEDLGRVVYEVPPVAGAEEPYPLPELKPDATKSEEGGPTP